MNRETYLKELQRYLGRLPKEDYENAMEYFTEYFDEAGPEKEADVIAELGTPKEAASEVLNALLASGQSGNGQLMVPGESQKEVETISGNGGAVDQRETKTQKSSVGRIILIAVLAILAAPVGIPIAIAAIVMLFSGIFILACAVASVLMVGCAGIISGILLLAEGIALFGSAINGALLVCGAALLSIGLGVLIITFSIWAGKQLTMLLIRLVTKLIHRKEG